MRQLEIDERNERLACEWALKYYARPCYTCLDPWVGICRSYFNHYYTKHFLHARMWLKRLSRAQERTNVVRMLRAVRR